MEHDQETSYDWHDAIWNVVTKPGKNGKNKDKT